MRAAPADPLRRHLNRLWTCDLSSCVPLSRARSSSLLLGELGGWSANQYLGCLLTFVAAGFYSYIKAAGLKKPAAPPVVAPEQGDIKKVGGSNA